MKDTPQYLKTNDMAKMIGYSKDYLLKHKGVFFFEGTHYFTKQKRTNWKVSSMIAWIENKNLSDKAKEILDLVS
ncbi:hypothetical protein [Sulfurovum mangrovi]|uniref:hypothetical protein n=1 Tax=Sulfurovum mangrovi TaxID=2893889 RepID=UPI001E4C8CC3|nr:hypothetical protein [Sulfurovum mangrovi]UFH58861.1 hypothetical protein LN246_10980 [Sulfurovum mangrovi]